MLLNHLIHQHNYFNLFALINPDQTDGSTTKFPAITFNTSTTSLGILMDRTITPGKSDTLGETETPKSNKLKSSFTGWVLAGVLAVIVIVILISVVTMFFALKR